MKAYRILIHIEYYRSSLVARLPPRFPSMAVCTANDGKLDSARGTRLVISRSAYELSCVHLPQAARASPSKERPLSNQSR